MQNLSSVILRLKSMLFNLTSWLERPWNQMKLNAEEIAERRQNKLERGDQNFLWCWKHRGFW